MITQTNSIWIFRRKLNVAYGSKILVCGSSPELGSWNPLYAIPMAWSEGDNWQVTLKVPLIFQYKYIIQDQMGNKHWDQGTNITVNTNNPRLFDENVKLMSYNIRFDNKADGQFAWKYRRDLAAQVLLEEMPSIIGVQEALKHQRQQLYERLKDYYQYFGTARDLGKGEECGIFYLRNRLKVLAEGLIWFNETKTPGKIGFGATLPRNLTYLVLEDSIIKVKFIIINTHLDHQSPQSRKQSVRIIIQTCESLLQKYCLEDIFIMGDFNMTANQKTLNGFKESKLQFVSARQKAKVSDNIPTMHDFKGEEMMEKVLKGQYQGLQAIDHIFYSSKTLQPQIFKTLVVNKPYMSDHYAIYSVFRKI